MEKEQLFNTENCAAEQYDRFTGKKVRIYYQDMKGTNRSLIGTVTECDGDNMWMENGDWRGVLNCANAKICIISTIEGWGSHCTTDDIQIYD